MTFSNNKEQKYICLYNGLLEDGEQKIKTRDRLYSVLAYNYEDKEKINKTFGKCVVIRK